MNRFYDLEAKRHGSPLFPLASYSLEYDKDTVILDCHWHSEVEFLLVKKGSGQFCIGDATIQVNEGEGVIIPGGCLHSGTTSRGVECSFDALVFSPDLLKSCRDDLIQRRYIDPVLSILKNESPLLRKGTALGESTVGRIKKIMEADRIRKPGYEMVIKILLLEIFLELYHTLADGEEQTPAKRVTIPLNRENSIKEALSFIHSRYEQGFTLRELAAAVHLSEAHFSRVFKKTVKMTAVEYLHFYRINRSVELLKSSRLTLAQISHETGYESVNYFIRRFKRVMNCTPLEFRRKHSSDFSSGTPWEKGPYIF